ncbi:MAG: helix-turn-helix transcriptional regulator [Candidatus Micrarchaeota archaeon]|nr:helix-turn-helix transcriptional regulator [Candidatus Micrarchaeota archaeon]
MSGKSTSCPTLNLLHMIGKKWTIPIVELLHPSNKALQFNEMQHLLVDITPKNLSRSLKELSDAKIVSRVEIRNDGIRYTEYSLTENGKKVEGLVRAAKELGICMYDMNAYCVNRQCHLCPLLKST